MKKRYAKSPKPRPIVRQVDYADAVSIRHRLSRGGFRILRKSIGAT